MQKKYILLLVAELIFLPVLVLGVTLDNPIGFDNFPDLFEAIIVGVADIIGALGGLMILVSGFLFMTSVGDVGKLGVAKKALLYAIIGMLIALLSRPIIAVVKSLMGATGVW